MFYGILRGPPYATDVCDRGDGCIAVVVELASDGNRIVSVICELTDMGADLPGTWEFAFSIGCFAIDDSMEAFETQDRYIAFPFIPNDVRPRVMDVVCDCLKALIDHAKPEKVYQVTKQVLPDEKPLKKHHMLTEVLHSIGYVLLEDGTDPFDRRFWTYGVLTLVKAVV